MKLLTQCGATDTGQLVKTVYFICQLGDDVVSKIQFFTLEVISRREM